MITEVAFELSDNCELYSKDLKEYLAQASIIQQKAQLNLDLALYAICLQISII